VDRRFLFDRRATNRHARIETGMKTKAWDPQRGFSIITEWQRLPGALLPTLHALQEEFGYIDKAVVPLAAKALNLSEAEIYGVISFYHDFRRVPPGDHILKICRAEACQSMGCDALIRHAENRCGVKLGQTTNDGTLTIEPVFCLGNCALSPAVMLDGDPYGRVSHDFLDSLINGTRRSV